MKGQYTHYLKIPNTEQGLGLRITSRYDWQTFTYKEEEKSGTRNVMVELPTEDDLKADILGFMNTHSILGSGIKAELIEAIDEHIMENGHPTIIEAYTYMAEVVDETTDHEAKVSDLIARHSNYFAQRISADDSEFVIKGDWTLAELNALPSGVTAYTNEEVKAYIEGSSAWEVGE
jgi:hypothetical protein